MNANMDFEALKRRYGSHSGAARALNISHRHYLRIRQGLKPSMALLRVIKDEIEAARRNLRIDLENL